MQSDANTQLIVVLAFSLLDFFFYFSSPLLLSEGVKLKNIEIRKQKRTKIHKQT